MAAVLLIGGAAGYALVRSENPDAATASIRVRGLRPCEVPVPILKRVARGYVPGRSGEVLMVDWAPNQFAGLRHSTPHPYTQNVPLVLYGPGFIRSGERPDSAATVADLAPTYAELLGFEAFPQRDGKLLREALLPANRRNGAPKVIFHLVWDGAGDNVLARWPDAWPNLRQLMEEGASYPNTTVGSSPSITPPIHSTMGTGAFPTGHGIPDMVLRNEQGHVVKSFGGTSPQYLRLRTLADLWDAANGNEPLVGMSAKDSYHVAMMSHGAYLPEGDLDIAILDKAHTIAFRTNESYYSLPSYVENFEGLDQAVAEVDGRDGEADGRWLGHELDPTIDLIRYSPVWPIFQTEKIIQVLETEGFGNDDVPDMFFANYKSTDLVGHQWNMLEPEERDTLAEQDRQLGVLLETLNRLVGRDGYVLALTADHGMNPYPSVTGGWAIDSGEVTADIERRFDQVTAKRHLVKSNRGYQLLLNKGELKRNDVTPAAIAAFVRTYRIRDNVPEGGTLPADFRERAGERVFMTALTPTELDGALKCARAKL